MADKTVSFSDKIMSVDIPNDMIDRIKSIYSPAVLNKIASDDILEFADLRNIYIQARTALFNLTGSFGSRTLNDYTDQLAGPITGLGIVEATIGDLENTCISFVACASNNSSNLITFSTNRSTFTPESNSSNFSGVNSSNRGSFSPEYNSTNFSEVFGNSTNRSDFSPGSFSSDFSGNGSFSTNRRVYSNGCIGNCQGDNTSNFTGNACFSNNSSHFSPNSPYNWSVHHNSQGGVHSTVHKVNFKSGGSGGGCSSHNSGNRSSFNSGNFASNYQECPTNFDSFGFCSGNRGSFSPAYFTSNFSGVNSFSTNRSSFTAGSNTTDFSINGSFSTNRSNYVAVANSSNFNTCSTNFGSNNTSVQGVGTCAAVHNVFRVEGVDF